MKGEGMSRKDTILIAVIINAGLLAILLATAVIYDPDKDLDHSEVNSALAAVKPASIVPSSQPIAIAGPTGDEVDNVLNSYTYRSTDITPDFFINEPVIPLQSIEQEDVSQETPHFPLTVQNREGYVEVTVKKGDVLEKIARANGTTVSAIKKINQLQNERLQIGQVLKIPVKQEKAEKSIATVTPPPQSSKKKEVETVEAQYYVIKSGDSPWKIAKQLNLKSDDILRLNNLDEESAKNLKAGDRIRVK